MQSLMAFAFIVVLPLVVVAAVLALLFGVGALFSALDDPQGLRARLEGAFRRPPKPPRPVGERHHYRAWWLGSGDTARAA